MGTSSLRLTSLIIGLGSLFFLVAAFLPVSKVFMEPEAEKKLEIINAMKGQWNFGILFFGLGSLVTVAGMAMLLFSLKDIPGKILPVAIIGMMAVGAILWSWSVTERYFHPEGFAEGTNTPYLFLIYSVLTQAGLVLLGILLIRYFDPVWPGWMFAIGGAFYFIMMVIFKDMPPLVYYVLTLVFSIVLFVNPGSH